MGVRVAALEARIVRVALTRPIRHASHSRTTTDNVVVRCELSDGSVGYGEGVPRDYVTGETAESSLKLLAATDFAGQLTACATFADAVRLAERLALPAVPGDDRECLGNAARCAAELALLDAFGRAFGEPVGAAVPLLAPGMHAPRDWVRYSGVILAARGWKARVYTLGQRIAGFKELKIKVGLAGHDDAHRLRVMRRCAGSGVRFRLDANEAWPAADAAARIRELEPADIASVEQPVAHEEVAALAEIRNDISTPVMLDESLCSMADARRAADGKWCDLFNLRLSKCGGFLPTLRLAEFARREGLGTQLGCQVGETGILSAAGRHFACSVGGLVALEGSYDRHLLVEPFTADQTFGRGGKAPRLAGPGLGAAVDAAKLDAATAEKRVLLG